MDIRPGGRFAVNHVGFLTIADIQPSDSGLYEVNISNSQGSALHTVQLRVILIMGQELLPGELFSYMHSTVYILNGHCMLSTEEEGTTPYNEASLLQTSLKQLNLGVLI